VLGESLTLAVFPGDNDWQLAWRMHKSNRRHDNGESFDWISKL